MSTESITESGHHDVVPPYQRQFLYDPDSGLYVPTTAYATERKVTERKVTETTPLQPLTPRTRQGK